MTRLIPQSAALYKYLSAVSYALYIVEIIIQSWQPLALLQTLLSSLNIMKFSSAPAAII